MTNANVIREQMYDAMVTCSERKRQTKTNGSWNLYVAVLEMWLTLAK